MKNFEELEKKLGIKFKDLQLLQEAMTHRSYLNERPNWTVSHNERLEYLGDAVLELTVSEELYKRFPEWTEGELTILRAALVNYQMLAKIAHELGLEKFILVSRGEMKDSGKGKEVILANAVEALIGSIYLDQGLEKVREFLMRHLFVHLPEILEKKTYKDAKSEFQEIIQERLKLTPTYKVLEEHGPAHQRTFKVGVYCGDDLVAEGYGSSKQEAELAAARQALYEVENFTPKFKEFKTRPRK